MKRKVIISVGFTLLVLFAAGAPGGARAGTEIIIDTDMGLDDVRAVLALLADTNSTVIGIATVEGSASLGKGTDNLIGLLEEFDRDDLPVFRGTRYSKAELPPWRDTADGLAGNPFPPPRHITVLDVHEGLHGLLDGREAPLRYLALGPLGNLATLEPEALEMIESIWLPAVIDNGILTGWNISFDPESAFDVLSKAGNVVIVDVGPARRLNARAILDSAEGSSAAARWIDGLLRGAGGHLMIYDEIAAMAAVRPELVTIEEERYRIIRESDDLRLERTDDGTIRIARIADMDRAARELVALWETGTGGGHHHDAAREGAPIDPELYIKTFHGHLGPYLVLGYRIGRMALRELDSEGHFGLSVVVHSILKPPASCLIDGVQLGSGCTLGKMNIEIMETVGAAFAEFENERGDRIRIGLRAEVPRIITDMIQESGVEEAGERLFHLSEESLFELRRP